MIGPRRLQAAADTRKTGHFPVPFEFRGGLFSNIRFGPRRHLWGDVMARLLFAIVVVAAGNLLAGAGALRHAASLPKALRGLHGNRLLDRNAGATVRLREALSGPPIEAASS